MQVYLPTLAFEGAEIFEFFIFLIVINKDVESCGFLQRCGGGAKLARTLIGEDLKEAADSQITNNFITFALVSQKNLL